MFGCYHCQRNSLTKISQNLYRFLFGSLSVKEDNSVIKIVKSLPLSMPWSFVWKKDVPSECLYLTNSKIIFLAIFAVHIRCPPPLFHSSREDTYESMLRLLLCSGVLSWHAVLNCYNESQATEIEIRTILFECGELWRKQVHNFLSSAPLLNLVVW